jgi:SHS2 domain-containing protein
MSRERPLPFIPFEPVDHTADLAFIARGRSLAELFTHAAEGMVAFLYDRATVLPSEEERIEATGEDAEELLVAWLQEILYRHEMRRRVYRDFRIESVAPPRLVASARGESLDPARHEILAQIKAATYHDLAIVTEATAAGPLLRVRVVLDT